MPKTPSDVLKLIKERTCRVVDLKFMDFIGTWQHLQFPVHNLTEAAFEDGIPFDGSSIRAWQTIEASDMDLMPDPTTAKIDPFIKDTCISLICDIRDPVTGADYSRDPRNIAKKAENYLKSTGIGDTAYFGPEAEFFIFDSVQYDTSSGAGYYYIDSQEAPWTSGEPSGNMGYKVRPKQGYFPAAPMDSMQDIRNEMFLLMGELGLDIEKSHHEVAPAQHEINFRFSTLKDTADNLQWYKYIIKNVAKKYDKVATFMPKPMFNDNGSGMHTHQSLWKGGKPLFAGEKYAGLSDLALWYAGGLIKHAKALAAFTNPTTNSYKRLVPGFEAPINLAYSNRNRSAAIRIPIVNSPKGRRLEFRCPDGAANAYLAFAAMMMAGLDGIQNKIDPGEPLDKDIYGLPPEELAKVPKMPGSLREAMANLEQDHQFLLKGGVFTKDVIEYWVDYKIHNEIGAVDSRPSPHEFYLYFDA
ncbi:MAG: type I glutamate--ammonia ligase [Candidatus Lambdaproteobacteria bacterium]|nr:type I glutamate--ammonia ligase [Candidatus Lambdaproteobacteria bacterium]